MGVWFDDPDIEMDDIYWYDILAREIEFSLKRDEGFISIDQEFNTKSCYVELHRNGELNSVRQCVKRQFFHSLRSHPVGLDCQNHIVAVTPMKFLSFKEFECRQKSVDPNSKLALMSSVTKVRNETMEKKKRAKAGFQADVGFHYY